MFELDPWEFPQCQQVDINGKRMYEAKQALDKYESVTTFLGRMYHEKNQKLKDWRKRVGEDAANRKVTSSLNRGDEVHAIAEKFLLNEEISKKEFTSVNRFAFSKAKSMLMNHIDKVHATEQSTWTDVMRLGGTFDALVTWNGELAILDFKTSAYVKKKKYIEHYFLQAAIYTQCVVERGFEIPTKNVIVFIPQYEEPKYYVTDPTDYYPKIWELIKEDRADNS